jgi:hypothetical protein
MVACPDTSIAPEEFQERIGEFQKTLIDLRLEFFNEAAAVSLHNSLGRLANPNFAGNPYPLVPPGSVITFGQGGIISARPPTPEETATLGVLRKLAKEKIEQEEARPISECPTGESKD